MTISNAITETVQSHVYEPQYIDCSLLRGPRALIRPGIRTSGWRRGRWGRGGEGGGRSPLPARAGRGGAADPVRVAGALKL